jgi:hypothetical protein
MLVLRHFRYVAFVVIMQIGIPMHAATQRQGTTIELRGEIKDERGAVIVGAKVSLTSKPGGVRYTTSDNEGHFHFGGLANGTYVLKVNAVGFATYEEPHELVDSSAPNRLLVTLYPRIINETVTVGNDPGTGLDPEHAAGTQTLSQREIEELPDDPTQLNQQLQMLASSSGSTIGGARVTVDGFTTGGGLPPKSSIRSVRINPDLFSAEYDTPPYRGGLIEIFTKPGASSFHGSGFFNFNNSALNARNAFALKRAPSRTERYGGQIGGPIVRRRAGFFLDFERRNINEAATINALILNPQLQPAIFAANVLTPLRLQIGSARVDWQISPAHTFLARYDLNDSRSGNQDVGGLNLPERASDQKLSEQSVRFSLTTIVSKKMLNELRVGLTHQHLSQRALSNEVATTVLGAFSSGGAFNQVVNRQERRWEVVDNFTVSSSKHSLKFGAQIYNKSIRDLRAENTNGTFIFGGGLAPSLGGTETTGNVSSTTSLIYISGLEQYRRTLLGLPGGVPTRFTLTRGQPNVNVNQWLASLFIQDVWRVRPNVSVNLGLRCEGQTAPLDAMSLAPRVGLSYSPDKKRHWALRARAGVFYERIAESLELEARRLDGILQNQFIVDAPSFPDPFQNAAALNSSPSSSVRRPLADLRPPTTFQLQVQIERELPGGWKFSASDAWAEGWNLLRSRNINAPVVEAGVSPSLVLRPFGGSQNILQFESSGRQRGRVLFVGFFQSTNKRFTLASGYLNFDYRGNADTPFMLPQSSYSESGEWVRPSWMSRHQLFLSGTITLPVGLRGSLVANANSGTPFNITTGTDNNGDGAFNDRPNVTAVQSPNAISTVYGVLDPTSVNGSLPRNAGTNASTISLDFNLARTFVVGKSPKKTEGGYKLALNVRASNLLNRTNLLGLNGVLASPYFGRANGSGPARRIEAGLRITF